MRIEIEEWGISTDTEASVNFTAIGELAEDGDENPAYTYIDDEIYEMQQKGYDACEFISANDERKHSIGLMTDDGRERAMYAIFDACAANPGEVLRVDFYSKEGRASYQRPSHKRESFSRFVESYLDSLERRQRRLR